MEDSQPKKIDRHSIDMLNGSFWGGITRYAVPLALTSIMQLLFNSADQAVAGRYVGSLALAAVGANAALINLLVGLFTGISVGSSSIIGRYIGAKNPEGIKKAIHTSILFAMISGVFIGIISFVFSKTLLIWMGTPEEVIDSAIKYLRFLACGMPFMMVYTYISSILRTKGDTKRSLVVIMSTGLLNVGLNIVFVTVFGMGVEGVALATAICQFINANIMFILLLKEDEPFRLHVKKLAMDKFELKQILRIGLPSGLNGMIFSISNVLIQKAVNSLGSTVMSANAAAGNFEGYINWIFFAFSSACLSFVSQNYGAGNMKRVKKSVGVSYLLSLIVTIALSAICVIFRHQLPVVFVKDQDVLELAALKMIIVCGSQIFNMTMGHFPSALRGLGNSLSSTIITLIGACGLRILWVYTVFAQHHSYEYLLIIYPISWIITSIPLVILYFITFKKKERELSARKPA